MKKNNLLSLMLVGSIAFFSSCSKDDHDHENHCSDECHIVLPNPAYVSSDSTPNIPAELGVWDIVDANGAKIEFCEEGTTPTLTFLEDPNNWEYTTPHELAEKNGGDPLPAGTYGASPDLGGYECHCEEHNH